MMSLPTPTYHPGDWVVVAGPQSCLLVDLPPTSSVVERCWTACKTGELDELLDALLSNGLRAVPSFALLHQSSDGWRAIVRGQGVVQFVDGSEVVADARAPWVDVSAAADPALMSMGEASAVSTVSFPLDAGVALAREVAFVNESTRPVPSATQRNNGGGRPDPTPTPGRDAGDSSGSLVPGDRPADALVSAESPALSGTDDPPGIDSDVSVPGQGTAPTELEARAAASAGANGYDHLFEATQNPATLPDPSSVSLDAVPPPEPTSVHDARWASTLGWSSDEPRPAVADRSDDNLGSAGLIDFVPGMSRPPSDAPGETAHPLHATASSPDQDEVEHTVNRALLRPSPKESPSLGPTVLAGHCPRGHLSAPHASRCRVCGEQMPPQSGFEVARPSLGVLRLSTGDVVVLDRAVLFGRAPEVPDDVDEQPNAVRLASPENDISRTHAEIELDGWNVYVRDLASTNGTVVAVPGQPPVRLHPHDPYVLEPGARVTLADEISFVFEVTG